MVHSPASNRPADGYRFSRENERAPDAVRQRPRAACDALVLDARLRQSLVTVRSLGRRGLRVAALETYGGVPAFSSRWCQQSIVCPAGEGTEGYLASLEQALAATGARALIASSDGTIALIRRYRERLERQVRVALAKEPALGIAINKERTLALARQLGLEVPRSVLVKGGSDLAGALREIGLPAVVKPVESWVADKQGGCRLESRLVTTTEEARRAVEALTRFGGAVLLQQFLSGGREGVNLFYAHGSMLACFAQRVSRTDPPLGGTSVLRQSIAPPVDISEQAQRLVREIDLEGYAEVEFRRDSAGRPFLMEINPRLSASIELAVRAGVDFPSLLYQWANGERMDTARSYRVGIWMRYLAGDIATTAASLRQRGRPGVKPPLLVILAFCASFFVPMRYDYLDCSDLLPAWTALAGWIRSVPKLARRMLPGNREAVQ